MKQVGNIIERMKGGDAAPARFHNPYLSEAVALDGILFTTSELLSRFPDIFPKADQPIVLEIGCYLGKTLIELASVNPDINFLGLDLTYKRTVKSAQKIKSPGLQNARVGICEGLQFLKNIPDASLSGTCVFFPDPWKKLKQQKKRLLQFAFFETLKLKLAPGTFFWLKTDDENYFECAMSAALAAGFTVTGTKKPDVLADSPYVTIFETIFRQQGLVPFEAVFINGTK